MDNFKYYLEITTNLLTCIGLIWAALKFLITSTPKISIGEVDFGKYTLIISPTKNWIAFKNGLPLLSKYITGDEQHNSETPTFPTEDNVKDKSSRNFDILEKFLDEQDKK